MTWGRAGDLGSGWPGLLAALIPKLIVQPGGKRVWGAWLRRDEASLRVALLA